MTTKQQRMKLLESLIRLKKQRVFDGNALNIHPGEFHMLHAICYHSTKEGEAKIRVSELAEYMHVSVPAVSQMLRGMETRGWIRRAMSEEDRRVCYVVLTDDGRKSLRNAAKRISGKMDYMLERLGPEDTEQLLRLFDRLEEILEEDRKEGKTSL